MADRPEGRPRLLVVALDVPHPPNYGGAVDMWERLRALHAEGVDIALHAFTSGRKLVPQLDEVATLGAHAYPRKGLLAYARRIPREPYMAWSRQSDELDAALRKWNGPILLEGVHCTHLLGGHALDGKRVFVRLHNDEAAYYAGLARSTANPLRKMWMDREAKLLETWQLHLRHSKGVLAISRSERDRFEARGLHVSWLPPCHGYVPSWKDATEPFALFHGNLRVAENEAAALWLVRNIAPLLKVPLVVAGNGEGRALRKAIATATNVRLVHVVGQEMDDLVRRAAVHALPTLQPTGVKLKLLHALHRSGRVVCSPHMVAGTGLGGLVDMESMPQRFADAVNLAAHQGPLHASEIAVRTRGLLPYDTAVNAAKLVKLIFEEAAPERD